ncbi:MAG: L-serine ammonia-lyase, iron-sulfur-dependent subunit beta [Ruthenibacterium sp.]
MNISIFDVVGPVMIGPSSSHTAGAARLSRVAEQLAPAGYTGVCFGLAGSFAKTGRGHGTDKALLAGAMGIREDEEALRDAYALAKARGLAYRFEDIELPDAHENAARITFAYADGTSFSIEGASIGGGRVRITRVDGMETDFGAEVPTLVISQRDVKGMVSKVSRILAKSGINIGVMRLTRTARGEQASCIIETDANPPQQVVQDIAALDGILTVRTIKL